MSIKNSRRRFLFLIFIAFFLLSSCSPAPKLPSEMVYTPEIEVDLTEPADILSLGSSQVFSSATYEVSKKAGVVYAEGLSHSTWGGGNTETLSLLLDIYEPVEAPDNRPAMILIHGGGFTSGSRSSPRIVETAHYFASRGWVCVTVDYRLADAYGTVPKLWAERVSDSFSQGTKEYHQAMALYPAGRDVKASVRWVYANASKYKINTEKITVLGNSAGAYLGVMLGITDAEDFTDELLVSEDPTLESTNLDQPSKVHSIVDLWGGIDLVLALDRIYGINRFDQGDAPILIIHGKNDKTVNFSEAERLKVIYEKNGVYYEFYPLEGKGHGAWDATVDDKSISELTFDFIVGQEGFNVED